MRDNPKQSSIQNPKSKIHAGHFSLRSIRARLTLAFSLATAALMLLTGIAAARYLRYDTEHDADALLFAAAQNAQRKISEGAGENPSIEFEANEPDLADSSVSLIVVDLRGNILRKTKNRPPPWPHHARDGWRVTTLQAGHNLIVAGLPWKATERSLQKQILALAASCVIVFFAVTLGVWFIVGQALSPIRRLSTQAQAASAESLRVHLSPSSRDAEIVELVDTLNGLLSRLSDAASMRGRFYAAASHELRTPLQALSGHLELALTRPRSAEAYREVIVEAHAQALRLMSLTRDLLLLNQLDSSAPPAAETVDPDAACERALIQMASLIASRDLCVEAQWEDAVEIVAPPTHLEMLTRNLIENAVKYAKEGGTIAIRFVDGGRRLEIFNASDPIPNWDGEKLFEPFYRLDASRNAKTGGNGLGLAICKAIAEANGWQIAIEQAADGVRAAVTFRANSGGTGRERPESEAGDALMSASQCPR